MNNARGYASIGDVVRVHVATRRSCTDDGIRLLELPENVDAGVRNSTANIYLAALDQLEKAQCALKRAYVYALMTEGPLRVNNQSVLLEMRDVIAAAEGRTDTQTQLRYELIAYTLKRAGIAA